MIFSNDAVARYLNDKFECAWQELRPVPQVWIDFGQGNRLRRTLNGNIATWFCTAKGESLDVVPGLVGADEFLRRARAAHELWKGYTRLAYPRALLSSYHGALARLPKVDRKSIETSILGSSMIFDVSKKGVERGLKQALALSLRAHVPPADLAKKALSAPTKAGFWLTNSSPRLVEDTQFNKTQRYPKAHAMLLKSLAASPQELTGKLFKELLHVDLDDPFLGLAPYVLGGEGGRFTR